MSDRIITGKDALKDLSDAKHDDVVFLYPPNDKKGNNNYTRMLCLSVVELDNIDVLGVDTAADEDLKKSIQFINAYDSIQTAVNNEELEKIKRNVDRLVTEITDKL